jgi:hypothetical protein
MLAYLGWYLVGTACAAVWFGTSRRPAAALTGGNDQHGYLISDGLTFTIRDITLREGKFWITATHRGPCKAGRGYATLFGADGYGVCQGETIAEWPACGPGEGLTVTYRLAMASVRSPVRP